MDMNMLEQYIKEVHSVKPYEADWTKEFPGVYFVEVDVTTNCYGCIERTQRVFDTAEWAKYQEQGYWMA